MARAGYGIRQGPAVWRDLYRVTRCSGGPGRLVMAQPGCGSRKRAVEEGVERMVGLGWLQGHSPPAALHVLARAPAYFCI